MREEGCRTGSLESERRRERMSGSWWVRSRLELVLLVEVGVLLFSAEVLDTVEGWGWAAGTGGVLEGGLDGVGFKLVR